MLVKSATLGQELGSPQIGDAAGTVLIEFSSGVNEDHYDPRSISSALFMLSPDIQTAKAPNC
jgi:hypothetical protein